MSVAASAAPAVETSPSKAKRRGWSRIERLLLSAVERLNPILVKETRQALKSRQFVITFLIVLAACWMASFAGVAVIGPEIRYAAAGGVMLIAYYAILAFPLAVIVPFTAFRSLAAEQEDNTYDLLSITTLTSGQIVAGKLCSAAVQMLVYFCAVSPCIAFTFLLRGVEATAVGLLLALTVLGSIGLSMIALMVGTLTKVRYTQVIISVALVLGLALAFVGSVTTAVEFHHSSHLFIRDVDFWIGLAALFTFYVTTFGLLFAAAAAQIAFPSENRSTPLRWWMVVQQATFLGWFAVAIALYPEDSRLAPELAAITGVAAIAYWFVMGALMTGEWPYLSRRVQRSLPQSTLGRVFLTWFNPGPSTGYLFAVSNLGMLAIVGCITLWLITPAGAQSRAELASYLLILGWSYVTAFLGMGRLIINVTRRFAYVTMSGALLIQLILILAGVGIPMLLQMISSSFGTNQSYAFIHFLDPLRTLRELVTRGPSAVNASTLLMIVPTAAVIALLLNLRSVMAEVQRQRTPLPKRLVDDDIELHPPAAARPTNPWDAEAADATTQ